MAFNHVIDLKSSGPVERTIPADLRDTLGGGMLSRMRITAHGQSFNDVFVDLTPDPFSIGLIFTDFVVRGEGHIMTAFNAGNFELVTIPVAVTFTEEVPSFFNNAKSILLASQPGIDWSYEMFGDPPVMFLCNHADIPIIKFNLNTPAVINNENATGYHIYRTFNNPAALGAVHIYVASAERVNPEVGYIFDPTAAPYRLAFSDEMQGLLTNITEGKSWANIIDQGNVAIINDDTLGEQVAQSAIVQVPYAFNKILGISLVDHLGRDWEVTSSQISPDNRLVEYNCLRHLAVPPNA